MYMVIQFKKTALDPSLASLAQPRTTEERGWLHAREATPWLHKDS